MQSHKQVRILDVDVHPNLDELMVQSQDIIHHSHAPKPVADYFAAHPTDTAFTYKNHMWSPVHHKDGSMGYKHGEPDMRYALHTELMPFLTTLVNAQGFDVSIDTIVPPLRSSEQPGDLMIGTADDMQANGSRTRYFTAHKGVIPIGTAALVNYREA